MEMRGVSIGKRKRGEGREEKGWGMIGEGEERAGRDNETEK